MAEESENHSGAGSTEARSTCVYHPDIVAAGTCENCGRPFCQGCIVEVEGKVYCRPCASSGAAVSRKSASDMAVASVILSASSLFFCVLTSIPGMILGFIELGRINRGESPEEGRGMAKAGAIIGAVMTGLTALAILAAIAVLIVGIIIAVLAAQ